MEEVEIGGLRKGLGRLISVLKKHSEVRQLSDKQLTNELIKKVWGELTLGTREEALLFEAIRRLENEP